MESLTSPSVTLKQTLARKSLSNGAQKDLWLIVKEGSLSELDAALLQLKKIGGNIDARNLFGLTPLHIATWRNHVPIVRRLLAAGADPDARDGESGWTSLHRALHFGHLAVASVLLQFGASLTLEDSKCRTPVDLLSGPVSQIIAEVHDSVATEVFSWGSGTNYQLGTGNAHIQKLPGKVDALHGSSTKIVAAAKFHSMAVGSRGELYTWGFGRGGRLGHPDFDIHSGQAAVITPRQVTLGLGSHRVKAVAAAKHHTVIATEGGEVYTWGSNREGQLGYTSVDTQPTPRRVGSFKTKVIAVAAANKHSAAISESGEVFTWGCNKTGQLGYGTSNSASNYIPRVVEYLKGKTFTKVSAAKYHTIVLGADGEVFTWGHRLVTPRRVMVSRNVKKGGSTPLKFHRMERLHVVSIAAGMTHSTVLTDDGSLFYWVSSDPDLKCQQLYSMCGRNLVSVSAGKYWTAVVSSTGDIYMWDGKKYKEETPVPSRLHGVKRATSVSVGETHLLIVSTLYHPAYPSQLVESSDKPRCDDVDGLEELDGDFMFDDKQKIHAGQNGDSTEISVPSLKSLCEKVAADFLVEPKNSIQLLEIADSLDSDTLRRHCQEIAVRNLDYMFAVAAASVSNASLEILVKLEESLDAKSSESWSYRRLPTPTATFPAIIDSEEDDTGDVVVRIRNNSKKNLRSYRELKADGFMQSGSASDQAAVKQVRALRKKLQQIDMLEAKLAGGHTLDDQQKAKLQTRELLECALAELGCPVDRQIMEDVKGSHKKVEVSRKQRRKSKQRVQQVDEFFSCSEFTAPRNLIKGFPHMDALCPAPKQKEGGDDEKNDSNLISYEEDSTGGLEGIPVQQENKKFELSSTKKKNKNRKGGLSSFLSGALDDSPKDVAPPPTPKIDGPAWGGAKVSKGPSSLRDIQNEQSKTKDNMPNVARDRQEEVVESGSFGQIRLGSFLKSPVSSPIAVVEAKVTPISEGEKCTPPWAASGTSPVLSRPSLRDIQMQQGKHQHSTSHSPKTKTTGFSVLASQGSPSEPTGVNRWFKPESETPTSSIRSIQIEERAMKDLKRFYSSVKLVKTQP
ncbi:hypothetical protein H6P81_005005 [Aristolochia fimbriata]|uniref:RCC1-like domain-containing protein n=1 Tax=Aristolochia fimbriata TaxID=158543 RepID=A0AAV7EWS7_ARIFI|nr:hypothetical protein H6P81_005005 [Aristolochia fimbriata]